MWQCYYFSKHWNYFNYNYLFVISRPKDNLYCQYQNQENTTVELSSKN